MAADGTVTIQIQTTGDTATLKSAKAIKQAFMDAFGLSDATLEKNLGTSTEAANKLAAAGKKAGTDTKSGMDEAAQSTIKWSTATDSATKKLDSAAGGAQKLGESANSAEKGLDSAANSTQKLGDTADSAQKALGDTAEKAKQLGDDVQKEGQSSDSAAKGNSNNSRATKELGDSSETASGAVDHMAKAFIGLQIGQKILSGISNAIHSQLADLDEASKAWQTFESNQANQGKSTAQIQKTETALQQYAQKTIYSASDMASTYSQLDAVGTKSTTKLVEGFGGLAAAAEDPTQAMKTMSQQATQMAAQPKVQWADFKLMLQQTPAGMSAVAKTMHKSTSQLITDIQAGKVSTSSFFDAIAKTGTNANFSQMATQFKTVGQAMDGLAETVTVKLQPAYNAVSKVLIKIISGFTDFVSKISFEPMIKAAKDLWSSLGPLQPVIKSIAAAVGTFSGVFAAGVAAMVGFKVATSAVSKITDACGLSLKLLSNPVLLVVAGVAALAVGFMALYKNSATFRGIVDKLASSVANLASKGFAQLQSAIKVVAPVIASVARSIGSLVSSGLQKVGPFFESFGKAVAGLVSAGLDKIGPLMDSMGGAFGKAGALISPVIGIIVKIGTAALGLSGPLAIAAGVVGSFLGMWAKTGQLNASGITQVFTSLQTTITQVSGAIAQYLPQLVTAGTNIIVSLLSGITAALPQIITAATGILTSLVNAIVTALPAIISVGTQIITTLVNGIVAVLPTLITVGVQLITELLNAIVAALPTLISAGLQIITALLNAIITNLPKIIDAGVQILEALVNGIISILPTLITAALKIVMALANALISNLPKIIDAGIKLLNALIKGLIQMLPQIITAAVKIITSLATALIQNLPKIIEAGVKLLTALIKGLIQNLPALIAAALKLVVALGKALIQNAPQILAAGVDLIKALVKGVLSLLGALGRAGLQLVKELWNKIKSINLFDLGVSLIKGLINGIGSMVKGVIDAAANVAKGAYNAIKKFLKIGSPSRVMAELGQYTGQGLINGIKGTTKAVGKTAKGLATTTIDSIADTLEIHSPSKVTERQGKYTGQGYINGLKSTQAAAKKAASQYAKSVSDQIAGLKVNWSTGKLGTASYIADLRRIQSEYKLTASQARTLQTAMYSAQQAQVKASAAQKAAVVDLNKKIKSENESFLASAQKINSDLVKSISDANAEYQKNLDDLTKSIYNQHKLFDRVDFAQVVNPTDLINNLKGQVSQFESWSESIHALVAKVPADMLTELRNMGVDSTAQIEAINSMTEQQLDTYVKLWQTKNTQAKGEATEEMVPDKAALAAKIQDLVASAGTALAKAKTDWIGKLKDMGDEAAKLGNYRAAGKTLGNSTVSGLIAGLDEMKGPLIAATQALADSVTGTIKSTLKIHSPSRVMRSLGGYIGAGLINGITSMIAPTQDITDRLAAAATPAIGLGRLANLTPENVVATAGRRVPSSQTINNITNNNGHGDDSESLKLLRVIANKDLSIDGKTLSQSTAKYSSTVSANRNKLTGRGLSLDQRI